MAELSYFEAGVLAAIYRGVNTIQSLLELFRGVDPSVVMDTVSRLEARGLIRRERRGLLFKREVLVLTEAGVRALDRAMDVLRDAAARLEEARSLGRPMTGEVLGWELIALAPLLLMMGLIPPMLFYSIVPDAAEDYGGEEYGDYDAWDSVDVDVGDPGF